MRKFNFTNRIISVWNNLSDSVVSLSADTVDTSKIRLDRFWIDQEIRYNWKADIRIGSRSQVNVILDRYFHICVYLELNIEVLDLRSETLLLLLLLIRRQAPCSVPKFLEPFLRPYGSTQRQQIRQPICCIYSYAITLMPLSHQ